MESWFGDAIVETEDFLVQKNSIGDDEHIKNRQFNPDTCALSILEGFWHEIGIIAEAFRGYLSPLICFCQSS